MEDYIIIFCTVILSFYDLCCNYVDIILIFIMKWTARQNYIKFEPAYEDIYCQNRMKFSLNGSVKLKLLTSLQLPPKNIQLYELNKMGVTIKETEIQQHKRTRINILESSSTRDKCLQSVRQGLIMIVD